MPTLKVFTPSQILTLEKVIEVLIATDGNDAIAAKDAALSLDEMLAESNSPALDAIPTVFNQLENIIPPLFGVFEKFSSLDLKQRRKLLNKVINNEGLLMDQFRDLSRALKVMSCISYYGSAAGMKQVGYMATEERPRFKDLDQKPLTHLEIKNHV
jgi:hypothetical protein